MTEPAAADTPREPTAPAPTAPPSARRSEVPAGQSFEGKYLVGLLLLLGVLAAGGSYWWHDRQIMRPRAFWGEPAEQAIRFAENVDVWELKPISADAAAALPASDVFAFGGQSYQITRRAPLISGVGTGFTFARRATMFDYTFDWDRPVPADCASPYDYALRFQEPSGTITALFALEKSRPIDDLTCAHMRYLEAEKTVALGRQGTRLLRDVFSHGFDPPRPPE